MASAKDLTLVVITPERELLNLTTDSVVLPAHDGELGVLRDRAPLMCELGVGQVRYHADGRTKRVVIDGGFAKVANNKVSVLTNRAVPAEDVTDAVLKAEEAAVAQLERNAGADRPALERARRRLTALRAVRA